MMNRIDYPEKSHSLVREILTFLFIAIGIVLPFRMFIAEPYIVSGESMFPTFDTGNYLIVDKISYKFKEPKRFDVVVMIYPNDTSKDFLKRIIGLPGETVIIKEGKVMIKNKEYPEGFLLLEDYVKMPKVEEMTKKLEDEEYFIMGDNRAGSFDSRYWGPLPKKDLVGKPIFRLLPLKNISVYPGKVEVQ